MGRTETDEKDIKKSAGNHPGPAQKPADHSQGKGHKAVGVTLAFETNVNILLSATIIGLVAFALAMVGGLLGRRLGELFQRRATLLGGLVLVGIGLKILLEHLSEAA